MMKWSDEQVDMIALVGDHNWRRGSKWRAVLAWVLGGRERISTHLGDVLVVSWWRGEPFLIDIISRPKSLP